MLFERDILIIGSIKEDNVKNDIILKFGVKSRYLALVGHCRPPHAYA